MVIAGRSFNPMLQQEEVSSMKLRKSIYYFTPLILAPTLLSTASGQTKHLQDPLKRSTFSARFVEKRTPPSYQNGAIVQFNSVPSEHAEPNLFLYQGDDPREHAVTVWPVGANRVILAAVAVGTDGRISVSGAQYINGRRSAFLESLRPDGTVTNVVNTDPYLATQLCRMPDGSVWTVGVTTADSPTDVSTTAKFTNYDALRHYSESGSLLEHFLPRWGDDIDYVSKALENKKTILSAHSRSHHADVIYQSPTFGPDFGFAGAGKLGTKVFMQSYGKGLVIFDSKNGKLHVWNSQNATLTTWRTNKSSERLDVDGLAVLSDGTIFASRRGNDSTDVNGEVKGKRVREVYELQPGAHGVATWKLVEKSSQIPTSIQILGGDDSAIVFRTIRGFRRRLPLEASWSTVSR